jgi:hypothetical protein
MRSKLKTVANDGAGPPPRLKLQIASHQRDSYTRVTAVSPKKGFYRARLDHFIGLFCNKDVAGYAPAPVKM